MNSINYLERRLHEAVNNRLRTFANGRFADACKPISVLVLMTERCNARCIHCDIWKNRGKEDLPSIEQWRTVMRDLRDWLGPVHVVFTGGEALLNKHTTDLVSYASSIGLYIEVLSHGFWEDQKKIENLAMARPARVTISLDAIGPTHSLIRGRENFFDKTRRTIDTLMRVRKELGSDMTIRLKTVIMRQNLDEVSDVARFAQEQGLEVFYQPIEQNYNTAENPEWFEASDTWPDDIQRAVEVVRNLRQLKVEGLPIANSYPQLEAMVPYFESPSTNRLATQMHSAHEKRLLCSALTMLQIQANGDVTICSGMPTVGNVKEQSIREVWEARPKWWESGCCLERRQGHERTVAAT